MFLIKLHSSLKNKRMQVLGTLNNLERILDKTFQECVIQPILYDSINELFKRGGDHA